MRKKYQVTTTAAIYSENKLVENKPGGIGCHEDHNKSYKITANINKHT